MRHRTKRCGRAGAAMRWFAAHDRFTTLRDYLGVNVYRRRGRDRQRCCYCTTAVRARGRGEVIRRDTTG